MCASSELPTTRVESLGKTRRADALAHVFTDLTILSQARSKIERRLAADPHDVKALHRLGDLQRKMGELDAALETYRILRRLQDDDMAAWRVGALNGNEPLTKVPDDAHPAPFVRVTDFLSAARQDTLLEAVRAGPDHFSPAVVSAYDKYEFDGTVDLEVCTAVEADGTIIRQVRPWFVEELKDILPKVFERFRVAGMREYHVELYLWAYQGGCFFRSHRDNGVFGTRQVSFVYYFHREPKSFVGGELLLHDSCPATNRRQAASFSRIEPVRNSLVFFPSGYHHEVLPVQCGSNAFEDARFAVNGMLHRASDWATYKEMREERLRQKRKPSRSLNDPGRASLRQGSRGARGQASTRKSVEVPAGMCASSERQAPRMADQRKARRAEAVTRVLTAPAVLSQARSIFERRLATDPRDVNALLRLGDLQREMGDLDAALATYRRLRLLQDDDLAAWRVGAMNCGQPLPNVPEGVHPAPFIRIADFLSAARQGILLEAVRAGPEHFSPARVGDYDKFEYDGTVNVEFRAAVVADGTVRRQVRPWFLEELKGLLPTVFERFGVADMREFYVELEVTAHRGGGFFRPHTDNGVYRSRQVSFVYYFHREPKSFVGGELLLHDSCPATNRRQAASFSRIEPVRNSLVFFPSGYYHEVLPVRCDSGVFEDARFTVNGWLHRASDWAAHWKHREEREREKQSGCLKPSFDGRGLGALPES